MILSDRDPAGAVWLSSGAQEAALHALGASIVRFHDDGTVEVEPDIDLTGYAVALSAAHVAVTATIAGRSLATAMAAGVQIISAGTAALTGTWGIAQQDEINIVALQAGIAAAAPWLGWYRDRAGVKHTMTTAQFTALATAILGYIEALDEAYAAAATGGAWSPPAQPVSIA